MNQAQTSFTRDLSLTLSPSPIVAAVKDDEVQGLPESRLMCSSDASQNADAILLHRGYK